MKREECNVRARKYPVHQRRKPERTHGQGAEGGRCNEGVDSTKPIRYHADGYLSNGVTSVVDSDKVGTRRRGVSQGASVRGEEEDRCVICRCLHGTAE
ncbi:beta-glucosidase [Cryptococcus neoformans]|nr:beta-glucosidase [Cryptococcus neoformans var. grubii]